MKPQICAQIDELFVEVLNGYGQKECRSLGRVIEVASEDILRSCVDARDEIITSHGHFQDSSNREEIYER